MLAVRIARAKRHLPAAQKKGAAHGPRPQGGVRFSVRFKSHYATLTSIFVGCVSGRLAIVTCSTPLVSSAVIEFGSTVSGSDTDRVILP